jgi:hypothetical protein
MVALDIPWPMATPTGSVTLEMFCELLAYQLFLKTIQDRFRLLQP